MAGKSTDRLDGLGRPVPQYLWKEWDHLAQVYRDAQEFIDMMAGVSAPSKEEPK